MVQYKKGILYTILFAIIRRKETTLMKRKWLFASLLLTAALTMTSCSFKLPVDLPFKIPFITADRNTKQNDEDPSDPEKATDPIITDEPEVLENIDTTENTPQVMIMNPIHLMMLILLRHNQMKTLLIRRPVRRILWTYQFSWEVLFLIPV